MSFKSFIKSNKVIYKVAVFTVNFYRDLMLKKKTDLNIKKSKKGNSIYYIGVPTHANLGDQAQYVCIMKWLKESFPQKNIIKIVNRAIAGGNFSSVAVLKKQYTQGDIILFQSGYTTTDLSMGDLVHIRIINAIPNARILMMPQTVYYKSEERQKKASIEYSKANNMLFLARDKKSYSLAKKYFENFDILLFPDIVTTLIGKYNYKNKREGVLLCTRNDNEKYYSDDDIKRLYNELKENCLVDITDTTKNKNIVDIVDNPKLYIENEIETYSKYKVIITDRFHGTIFSLAANTPVIVLQTTDHKVTTGAEWFLEVYDKYIYMAKSIEEAVFITRKILGENYDYSLTPYFCEKYYDKLKDILNRIVGGSLLIICKKELCTGCAVCKEICTRDAISIVEDERGFVYPSIDETKCVNCKKCVGLCPQNNQKENGYLIKQTYAAWNKDNLLRKAASSGGIFSLLAEMFINNGGVVVGVEWNSEMKPIHVIADDLDGVKKFYGSKYVQSSTEGIYSRVREFLEFDRSVLFVGTPCQNAALRSFLGKEYDKLLQIDLVCHGVPSYKSFKRYLAEVSNGKKITDVKFRYKNPYQDYFYFIINYSDGTKDKEYAVDNPFFQLFNKGFTLRDSCHKCKYTSMYRQADVTLADYWGFVPGNLKMSDFNKGVSLVTLNTQKGKNIFKKIEKKCIFEEHDVKKATASNKCFREPYSIDEVLLEKFWEDYKEGLSFDDLLNKYFANHSRVPKALFWKRLKRKYRWVIKK